MSRSLALAALVACHGSSDAPARSSPQTIRVAVIGGMLETGFWQELSARYERLTGNKVELAASGPKPVVVDAFRKRGIDLITFHASDAFANLVADGLAVDPQPWVRNDLVIVGPHDDPAQVRGERDALVAVNKIIDSKASFVVHASMGADGVLHDLLEGHAVLPAAQAIVFDGENQHDILARAADAHAYTMVGRIPFIDGKLKREGIDLMVRGDPRLRRPYLVAVAAGRADDPRLAAARDLAAFLRDRATQEWIAAFGKGKYDDDPLFFPVTVNARGRSTLNHLRIADLNGGPTVAARPGVMKHWMPAALAVVVSASASAEPMQVTLGAEVGGGSVSLNGSRYGSVDAGIDIAAARWLSPHYGIGLRVGYLVAAPVRDPRMDGYPIDREVPWSFEPELLARTTPTSWGPARLGWLATAGLGLARLNTQELCGGGGDLFDEHSTSSCVIVKDRTTAVDAAASGGGYLEVGHVAMFVGVRASGNSGGDGDLGLVANLGATFERGRNARSHAIG